ncbi:hypothetical protein [Novosphingobium clariflavum]|uniref:Uncharacterized protein n=1 Tax=Novosphingobium clariflavum TaxID=2029884 RepID=A0ABV6S3C5_9SPHN|nr:hypothetical protein [Novosphingobium clariflavum]
MALGTCLTDLHARGAISDARFEQLRPVYEDLVRQYEGRYGRAAAESMATEKALQWAEGEAMERKRQVLLQANKQGEWLADVRRQSGDGPLSRRVAEDKIVDMDNHRRAIRQQALGMMDGLLAKHRRNLAGRVRAPEELADTLAEVFGRDTGNLNARELADAWRQTSEWLRSRFNAAGGRIAKLDSWNLPQTHDMWAIRDGGFDAWRDFLLHGGPEGHGLLDRSRMVDRDTGELFTDAKLETVLRDTWEAIATDGWSRNNPGAVGKGAMANRRADPRFLHFDGPEAWTAYAQRFGGGGTPFDAMLSHVEGMSRDIAAMERMGPNPSATLLWQKDWLKKSTEQKLLPGKAGKRASDEASAGMDTMQKLFDEYTGANNRPVRRRLALGFSIFRAQQVAAKLGGATLAIGGDYGTMFHTSRFNKIPATKVMARYVSMLNPANAADRAQAARHVLMADQWAEGHAAMWRTTGEEIAHEGMRRLSSGVLRVSGLSAHTDIARQAFGMELVSHLTHMRERSFDNLDNGFRRMLQRYGIGETHWERLRGMQPESYKGTDWLYPETVANAGEQDLADNLMRMIVTEADYAVPVPDLRTRAAINSGMRKGTWIGEIVRSGFLFKGFPLTMLNMHGRRMLDEGGGGIGGLAAAAAWRFGMPLLAMTTVGGALSVQAKEVAKGRDPMPMNTLKFWGAALAQGGGLGIVGDFLYSMQDRFGGGIARSLAGPGAQTLDNTVGSLVRNTTAALDDDPETKTQWKKDAARLLLSETPGISLWYARLVLERSFGDMVTQWAYGDDVEAHYRRLDQSAEDRGTQYFAPPGGGLGDMRAPDWSNTLGQQSATAEPAPY